MGDPEFSSIDVDALEQAVNDLDATLSGLTDHVAGLEDDFNYFGVDKTQLSKLLEAKNDLETIVPDLRERHRLAVQLLAETTSGHPALDGSTIVTFEGDILDDLELAHRADVSESIEQLRAAGLLDDAAPGVLYREWISWTLKSGLTPQELVDRAREEGVTADTFDVLNASTIWRTPDGRPYVRIEDADSAREIAAITELLNGGQPSLSNERRDGNNWSFEGLGGLTNGDVGLVLNNGGALVATPEGTMMAAPGNKTLGIIPNTVDWFAARGGTTWGEVYVINGSFDSPEDVLRDSVESGDPPPGSGAPDLERLLRHERVHSEQWARYGYTKFIWKYLFDNDPNDPCNHPLEQEAGLDDGGYPC